MATQKTWAAQFEFWLSWMLVLGISWPGIAILTSLLRDLFGLANSYGVNLVVTAFIGGLMMGVVQWFFLRPSGQGGLLFTLMTALGWAAGLIAVTFRVDPAGSALMSLGRGFLAGLILGLFQLICFRSELRAGWVWPLMSAGSWALAMAAGGLLVHVGTITASYETFALGSLDALMGWVVLGLLSCVFLIGLFPRQRARESDKRVRWMP